eukprot:CAMPEP_0115307440 /NCGR_PEP_ID=MMETSP0270-20121206/73142_1 /TAXON_ID=71861 /ORGANISM="Scrippsiella trochoidea, Strain CCMP3099" /LENGTH=243 /DNA_ID=CAMNT_0002725883 /DNA_START=62 /DNA_END=793 /DNA_ORIENTATION=+
MSQAAEVPSETSTKDSDNLIKVSKRQAGGTGRSRFSSLTSVGTCASCHAEEFRQLATNDNFRVDARAPKDLIARHIAHVHDWTAIDGPAMYGSILKEPKPEVRREAVVKRYRTEFVSGGEVDCVASKPALRRQIRCVSASACLPPRQVTNSEKNLWADDRASKEFIARHILDLEEQQGVAGSHSECAMRHEERRGWNHSWCHKVRDSVIHNWEVGAWSVGRQTRNFSLAIRKTLQWQGCKDTE